jgi:hypothetical protein
MSSREYADRHNSILYEMLVFISFGIFIKGNGQTEEQFIPLKKKAKHVKSKARATDDEYHV